MPRRMLSIGPPKQAEKPMIGAKTYFERNVSERVVSFKLVTYRDAHICDKVGE